MKKIVLSAMAFMTFIATPALAQYPGGYRDYPDRRPPPPVERYERGPYVDHRRGPPPRREMHRRNARVCVTSRGSCPASRYMFPGENCSCHIPGFGMKRGNAR